MKPMPPDCLPQTVPPRFVRHLAGVMLAASVLAAPLHTAMAADPAAAAAHYERALELIQQDDFRGGVIELKNALQDDPDNIPARLFMGDILLLAGDGKSAEAAIVRAQRAGADEALTVLPLAQAYLLQGKNEEVLTRIRRGNRANDIEAGILAVHGEALLAMRRLDEATTAFSRAEDLDPLLPESTLGLARVAMLRGDMALAKELADRAIAKNPDVAQSWYVRGEMYRTEGESDRALADLDKSLELRNGNLPALRSRAAIYIQKRRWDEARRDLEQMQEISPTDPYTAYMLAQVHAEEGNESAAQTYLLDAANLIKGLPAADLQSDAQLLLAAGMISYALGKLDDTIYYLGQYLKLNTNHLGARKLLAQAYIRNGATARAVEVLRPTVQQAPNDHQLMSLMGSALVEIGSYEEGMSFLERAVNLRPDSSGTRLRRAQAQFTAGAAELAITDLEAVIELNPDATQPRYMLAVQYLNLRAFDKAQEMARSIVSLRPENPLAHDLLGQALVGAGKIDEARAAFGRALEIDPAYVNARYNLGQLALAKGELEQAETDFKAVLERQEKDVRAMRGIADIYKRRNNVTEAIQWMEQVRNTAPGDLASRAELVLLYLSAGKNETAYFLAEKLYQENPTAPVALEAFARANQAMNRGEKAVELLRDMAERVRDSAPRLHYVSDLQFAARDEAGGMLTLEKAVRTEPGYVPAQLALIDKLSRAGKADEALARLQLLESAQPELDLLRLRGDALAQARRYADAATAYRKGLERHPDSARLAVNLYVARKEAGEREAAFADLENWVKAHPGQPEARFAYATALSEAGRTDEAIAEHLALMQESPADPRLYNNLAWLYHGKDDKKALEMARKAFELAPGPPDIKDTLGWMLVQNGQVDTGLGHLREAHVRDSRNPDIRLHLAITLSRLGRVEEARRGFEELIRLSPDSAAAKRAADLLKDLPAKG